MTLLKASIVIVIACGGFVALMYAMQRSLMYFPERGRTPPAVAGLPAAQELTLDTADGEKLVAWYVAPRDRKAVGRLGVGDQANLGRAAT